MLGSALEGDVVAQHLTWVDEWQNLFRNACFLAANCHDTASTADSDVGHVLNQSSWQNPLVFIELIERAPTVASELEDRLNAENKLSDVVLLVLEVCVTTNDVLASCAILFSA